MKRWRVEVFVTIHGKKSARGNWYEGTFRHWRAAYIVARWMAWWCDLGTPKKLYVSYDVWGSDDKYIEEQDSPYGIAWGIRPKPSPVTDPGIPSGGGDA